MKSFFNKYKVLIIGLLTAVALPLNDLITTGETSAKVLAFASVTALLSYAARNFRGQWATIAGFLGTTVATYLTMQENGSVSWAQLVLQLLLQLLAAAAPPAKSRGYENTDLIESAKQKGELAVPTSAHPKP